MSQFLKQSHENGIVHIQSTANNTIITLTDLQGNTKFWASGGTLGFKNAKKADKFTSQLVAEKVAKKALELGFDSVILKVQGLGYGKTSAVRCFSKSKLKVTRLIERTPIAHNGCRPPKKRRT